MYMWPSILSPSVTNGGCLRKKADARQACCGTSFVCALHLQRFFTSLAKNNFIIFHSFGVSFLEFVQSLLWLRRIDSIQHPEAKSSTALVSLVSKSQGFTLKANPLNQRAGGHWADSIDALENWVSVEVCVSTILPVA